MSIFKLSDYDTKEMNYRIFEFLKTKLASKDLIEFEDLFKREVLNFGEECYENAYEHGKDSIEEDAYDEGYDEGHKEGYEEGFEDGKEEALEEAEQEFKNG